MNMPKIVAKNIIKQVQKVFDDFDKKPDSWDSRDILMATLLKKYKSDQYDDIAIIIGDYMANNDDRDFNHNSIAMDIVASLVFFSGDLDGVDILLHGIPAHPKSNLRAQLAMATTLCKGGICEVKEYREVFTNVGEK
jgi:hypothetical protein